MVTIIARELIPILHAWHDKYIITMPNKDTRKGKKSRCMKLIRLLDNEKPVHRGTLIELAQSQRMYSTGNLLAKDLRQCIEWGIDEGLLTQSPFRRSILPRPNYAHRKIFLSADEMDHLKALNLTGKLARTRDYFLLQCYTGLAYSDFKRIRRSMRYTNAGNTFLVLYRKKTKSQVVTPIVKAAIEILERFDWDIALPTNQVYNRNLKHLYQISNLKKDFFTSHLARKTCAQYYADRDFSLEEIAQFLGISIKTLLEHYCTISIAALSRKVNRLAS